MDIEALRTLIVPDMGVSLDCPHPASLGNVEETSFSAWADSADPRDVDGGIICVKGRIIETAYIDEFQEVIGKPQFLLQHQYDHPQRRGTNSMSATTLTPRNMHGEKDLNGHYTCLPLRKRFPAAFDQFEKRLRSLERPFPIALLDNVPPEVCEALIALGIDTVNDFAAADDAFMARLKTRLENDRYVQRAQRVADYRERARELVGPGAVALDEPAHRGPGRPRKLAN